MQKQKTMAKWLAVILLLMVAVACYVIFSTALKKDSPVQSTEAASTKQTTDPSQIDKTTEQPKTQIYSTFPRRAEQIGGYSSQHVGGEADETALALYSLDDKTYLFFSSASEEYDSRGEGIYLATIQNDYLLSVEKIAEDETYLASSLSKNGIVFATMTSNNTVLRLISARGEIVATNKIERYVGAYLTIDKISKNVVAFATDDSFVYALEIGDNLAISKSNFVLYINQPCVKKVVDFGAYKLVLADGKDGFEIVSFDSKNGFIRQNRMINCIFSQFFPSSSSDVFSFVLLLAKNNGANKSTLICTFSSEGQVLSSYLANEVQNGVLKQVGDTIALFSQTDKYTFCSHLELVAKEPIRIDKSLFAGDPTLSDIEGTNMFLLTDGITLQVLDADLTVVFCSKGKNLSVDKRVQGATTKLRFVFEAKANDSLTYAAFGNYDVFIVETTT